MEISFTKALSERYLSYALSTIVSRSLPDVRDGLKPVHRRLIYAMYELKLDPKAHFKKCARVVGDVMGKFHPHGDSAIYNAMVRLAQDFSVRYPLIEGQGNFGNIDGDSAAAMRYTEAKLTPIALELLKGIEENAVDTRENYDGETIEPIILPALFPNILANGATGIAVGMATSIPPHNLEELLETLIKILENKNDLTSILGPDFPTGGIIVDDPQTIAKIYETGKGCFRLRARFFNEITKNGDAQIIITEIPYQIEKSQLIRKIADLIIEKKISGLEDIRDESAEHIRIILVIKAKSNPYIIMEDLFKASDLQTRVHVNLNVLNADQTPSIMSLHNILRAFLDHRILIQKRILKTKLEKKLKRLFLLDGYRIVYQRLEEIIKIIRFEDKPKDLMIERYALEEEQVEAILNIRLRSLEKIQEAEIQKEYQALLKEKHDLESVLESETKQKKMIKKDLERLISLFGKNTTLGKRKTTFEKIPDLSTQECAQEETGEDVVFVCSQKKWIRVVKNANDIRYKEGDEERFVLPLKSNDTLLIVTSLGKFFTIPIHKIPKTKQIWQALRDFLNIEGDILKILVINSCFKELLLISEDAKGFRVRIEDVLTQAKAGKQIYTGDISLARCLPVIGDTILMLSSNRKMLALPITDVPLFAKGKGVILQKTKKLSDAILVVFENGFSWTNEKGTHHQKDLRKWIGAKATAGRLAPLQFPKENLFHS